MSSLKFGELEAFQLSRTKIEDLKCKFIKSRNKGKTQWPRDSKERELLKSWINNS